MATVQEVLKASGFTDDQISALDPKAIGVFSTVLTTAETEKRQAVESAGKAEAERKAAAEAAAKAEADRLAARAAQDAAEVAQRANREFYENQIAPALTGWDEQKQLIENARIKAEAEASFWKTQADGAKAAGFISGELPKFEWKPPVTNTPVTTTRDAGGRYVAGAAGATPGSPTFTIEQVRDGLGQSLSKAQDIQWKYQKLYGQPMPISPTELFRRAENLKLDVDALAEREFKFSEKEQELQKRAAEQHDEDIRKAAQAEWESRLKARETELENKFKEEKKTWAERSGPGSNPDVRGALPAKMAEVSKAVKNQERPDPLKMTDIERKQATTKQVRQRIEENSQGAAA